MSDREPAIITDCRRYASDSTIGENARKANQQYVDAYDELRQQLAARDQEIERLTKKREKPPVTARELRRIADELSAVCMHNGQKVCPDCMNNSRDLRTLAAWMEKNHAE